MENVTIQDMSPSLWRAAHRGLREAAASMEAGDATPLLGVLLTDDGLAPALLQSADGGLRARFLCYESEPLDGEEEFDLGPRSVEHLVQANALAMMDEAVAAL